MIWRLNPSSVLQMDLICVGVTCYVRLNVWCVPCPLGTPSPQVQLVRPTPPSIVLGLLGRKCDADVTEILELVNPVVCVKYALTSERLYVLPGEFRQMRKLVSKRVGRNA